MTKLRYPLSLIMGAALALSGVASAQSPTARDAAVLDLSGYWVSVVSEDWKYRMVTPNRGEFGGLPLNAEGRGLANSWDPTRDDTSSDACKAYGAPAIMRMPGRFNIGWEDDATLSIETDAGAQTRMLYFAGVPAALREPSRQGLSTAEWRPALWEADSENGDAGGSLKVMTTNLLEGYLRRNGVPYSADTVVTEYFNTMAAPNGDQWLIVTTIVEDPVYLSRPYVTSSNFKKLDGRDGWNPTPCEAS